MFFFLSIFFPKGQLPVSYLIILFLICTFIYLAKIPLQGPRYQLGGSNFLFCFFFSAPRVTGFKCVLFYSIQSFVT